MKKIIFFSFLFISLAASAQDDATEDTVATPVITAVGKPDGKKTEIKLTKDGGRLISSDGMVELIFPAGAISKKTDISIQPITNLMPNGNGKAYRFEPSGIQFQKPVQVIFHYDEDETKDSLQLLLGIAMQDAKGQWLGLNKSDLDTVAKTISGSINHFSDWSSYMAIKLYPSYARVKVNKELDLVIDLIASEGELAPLVNDPLFSALRRRRLPWTSTWSANGILNGNSVVGTVTRQSKVKATYKAPAKIPDRNPVEVAAQLTGITYVTIDRGRLITLEKLLLVSNILVYDDAYEVTMISEIQEPGAGTRLGAVTYKDTGSFVVSLNGREARIIERVNRNTTAALGYLGGCCWNFRTIKPGTGNIHISGTPVVKVTPPTAPGKSAIVEIRFSRFPAVFPTFQVTCQCPNDKAPMNFTNAQGIVMMANFLRADPEYVKFEAKEGEQIILQNGAPGGPLYTKFTVKQIREE